MSVSERELKKDMNEYIRLLNKSFTAERYNRKIRIENRARDFLDKYHDNRILAYSVHPKVLADFAAIFSYGDRRDEILAKIEKVSGLDTKKYLRTSRIQLRAGNHTAEPSALKLRLKTLIYKHNIKRIRPDRMYSYAKLQNFEDMRAEAKHYLAAYMKGDFELNRRSAPAMIDYFKTVFSSHNEEAQTAIARLEKQIKSTAETKKQSPALFSGWKNFKEKISAKKESILAKIKTAAVVTLTVAAGIFGVKSCQNMQTKNAAPDKVTFVKAAPDSAVAAAGTPEKPFSVADMLSADKSATKTQKTVTAEKIWNNYYDNTLDILCGARQKEKIYGKIAAQIKKGIFSLPQDISREKAAYAYVIYQKYGLTSGMEKALNSKQKLSAETMAQVVKDIHTAENKGIGVKKLAQQKFGRLKTNSSYQRAGKKLQQQHADNLKELLKMRKQAQNN